MPAPEELIAKINILFTSTAGKYDEYLSVKNERDEAIREAISQGVTMYAIAKATGISQAAIAKIRDTR